MSTPGPSYTAGYCAAVINRYTENPDLLTARLGDAAQRDKLAEFNTLVADTATNETKSRWVEMLISFIEDGADNDFVDMVPAWFDRLDGNKPPDPPATGRRGGRRGRRNGELVAVKMGDDDDATVLFET